MNLIKRRGEYLKRIAADLANANRAEVHSQERRKRLMYEMDSLLTEEEAAWVKAILAPAVAEGRQAYQFAAYVRKHGGSIPYPRLPFKLKALGQHGYSCEFRRTTYWVDSSGAHARTWPVVKLLTLPDALRLAKGLGQRFTTGDVERAITAAGFASENWPYRVKTEWGRWFGKVKNPDTGRVRWFVKEPPDPEPPGLEVALVAQMREVVERIDASKTNRKRKGS